MSILDLAFGRKASTVPKRFLFELLNHDWVLLDARTYSVRSSVPTAVFEMFLDSLNSHTRPTVTTDNVASLSLLAQEFFDSELITACATLTISANPFQNFSDRVSRLERQMASLPSLFSSFQELIASQDKLLETLRFDVETLRKSPNEFRNPSPLPAARQNALRERNIPMEYPGH